MRFRHILITMFNRRLGGRGRFPRELELDENWLRYRWTLFTTYTVPSVAAQSESDFTWLVLCHPDSPAWFRTLTGTVDMAAAVHFSFSHLDPARSHFEDNGADALLVTRIDSDDSWHRRAMERIREDCEADPYTSEIVTLSDGYLLDSEARRMRPYHHFSPPFATKINLAPNLDPLDYGGNHIQVRRRFPSRSISDGEPMFTVVIHGSNTSRRRDFDTADPRWLTTGATAEILSRDFGVTLNGGVGGGASGKDPVTPAGLTRRPRAGTPGRAASRYAPLPASRRHRVVVSIPCFRAWNSVVRAAESILDQTHSDLLVIVANDGDTDPQWETLRHIDDPRLIRIDYPANRGRYFIDQIALMARLGQYLLVQDADDWSEPGRVTALFEETRRRHSVAAVSSHYQHPAYQDPERPTGPAAVVGPALASAPATPLYLDGLDRPLRSAYHVLFDAQRLLRVGGCYGGYRVGYGTFLLHLIRMTGPVAQVDQPLYHHVASPLSLAAAEAGGPGAALRRSAKAELASLYQEAYHVYCEYLQGSIGCSVLGQQLRALAWRHVSAAEWDALREEASRLRWHVNASGRLQTAPTR